MESITRFLNKLDPRKSNKLFAFYAATVSTILTFSVFLGQKLQSDIVTIGKNGDQYQSCYPAFFYIGKLNASGIFWGVDSTTYNGSVELFLNLIMNKYVPYTILSLLGFLTSATFMYILFYAIHMFVYVYFAQLLGQDFFGMNKWISFFMAICYSYVFLYETWFTAFMVISALVFPLIYFSLKCLNGISKKYYLLLPIPYLLAFTSGYSVVSCFLPAIVVLFAILYGFVVRKELSRFTVVKRVFLPALIGGVLATPYLLQLFLYATNEIQAPTTLYDATILGFPIDNLPHIFLRSYKFETSLEQTSALYMGIVWIFVILTFINGKIVKKMNSKDKFIFNFGLILNGIIMLINFGTYLPVGAWFYSLIPVLGTLHLPGRFMCISMAFLYISLCTGLKYLAEEKRSICYKRAGIILIAMSFVIIFVSRVYSFKAVYEKDAAIEFLITGIVMLVIFFYGWTNKKTLIVWGLSMLIFSNKVFYGLHQVYTHSSQFAVTGLPSNPEAQIILDNFVDLLDEKEKYKFAAYETANTVPQFVSGFYTWYDMSKRPLSNYLGYGLHATVQKEYLQATKATWFDTFDWNYLLNTRADFVVTDMNKRELQKEFFDRIVATNIDTSHLYNGLFLFPLKKYIPQHYTNGKEYIEDDGKSFDNGYFYSPDISDDNFISFETDEHQYYSIKVNSPKKTDLQFSLYPNRHYKYYVDDKEVDPMIDYNIAYVSLNEGEHEVRVQYKNLFDEVVVYVTYGSYVVLIGGFGLISIIQKIRKKEKKGV